MKRTDGKTYKIVRNKREEETGGYGKHNFELGSTVYLYVDDGTDRPAFINDKGDDYWCYWDDVEEVGV